MTNHIMTNEELYHRQRARTLGGTYHFPSGTYYGCDDLKDAHFVVDNTILPWPPIPFPLQNGDTITITETITMS